MHKFILCALLTIFYASPSQADQPAIGGWSNPNESGRGWNIERQNDIITIVHYVYDASGKATFYINSGVWNETTKTIEGDYYAFDNGQCIGCSHRPPRSSRLGHVKAKFTTSTKGNITYSDGTVIPIEKMNYGFESDLHKLQGAWSTAWYTSFGADFSHAFYSHEINRSGSTPMVVGRKLFSQSGRSVVTGVASGINLAVIDASTNYYDYYYYLIDGELIKGVACTALKTSTAPALTACKGILFGSRTHTLHEAQVDFSKASLEKNGADYGDVLREGLRFSDSAKSDEFISKIGSRNGEVSLAMEHLRRGIKFN